MGKAVNIDAVTGEITEYEVEDIVVDSEQATVMQPQLIQDPVDKLKAFLVANPDVAVLLQGDS